MLQVYLPSVYETMTYPSLTCRGKHEQGPLHTPQLV